MNSRAFLLLSMVLATLVVASMLLTTVKSASVSKGVAELDILNWTSIEQGGIDRGVPIWWYSTACLLPFGFSPEEQSCNVTDLWIVISAANNNAATEDLNITVNDGTPKAISHSFVADWYPEVITVHIDDVAICQSIQPGVNTIEFIKPTGDMWIYRVSLVIEYEYEVNGGVGGLYIPIDKLELLTPYIALAFVLVVVIILSAITWKHWLTKSAIQRIENVQTP